METTKNFNENPSAAYNSEAATTGNGPKKAMDTVVISSNENNLLIGKDGRTSFGISPLTHVTS